MTSRLRLIPLALLSLCLASPAFANRARTVKKTTTTTAKAQVRTKAVTKPVVRPGAKTVKTGLVNAAKPISPRGIVRVNDKASVEKADAAVVKHLAKPLTMRGPKAQRLNVKDAHSKISNQWTITDTKIVANADPHKHPITGNATVVVNAQRMGAGKVKKALGMKTKREFIVNIGTNGSATVVGERSGAGPAKLMRLVNEKLAISRIVRDVVSSKGVRKAGASMGVLALAVLAGNSNMGEFASQMGQQIQLLGPVVMTAAAISAKNGMGRRTTARLHVFEQLTKDFGRELSAGKSITVEGAYKRYTEALKEVKIGKQVTKNVKPPSREHFVKALAAWETGLNLAAAN
jgi:hypothetical protein